MRKVRPYVKLIRPHQWAKNFLVAVPAVTTQNLLSSGTLLTLLLAFVSFSLLSSSVYIFNDFIDRTEDRLHETKRSRPLASLSVSVPASMILAAALGAAAFGIASSVGLDFLIALVIYLSASTLYSVALKRAAIADVILLAILYTLRIIAGGLAIGVNVSFWLMAFSVFFFLSLALVKRTSEIRNILNKNQVKGLVAGRGYSVGDLDMIQTFGLSSGFLSVLVYALYLQSDEVTLVYRDPRLLWLFVPILIYWIGRLWLKTQRGEVSEDPVLFAIKDKPSILIAAIGVGLFLAPQIIL